LFENIRRYNRFVIRHDSAGVNKSKDFRFPFDFAVNPVARNARFIADDGLSASGQAIEQR
jgi:hypothetical protein